MGKRILAATLGPCVHVTGVFNFLNLAKDCGFTTHFLGIGPALERIVECVRHEHPEYLALSFRLTPEVGEGLWNALRSALVDAGLEGQKIILGGTPPVAALARQSGLFAAVFGGEEDQDAVLAFLRGEAVHEEASFQERESLLERMKRKDPLPLLRHHFGLPDLEATIAGVKALAEVKVLDVISLAPDQNAQASFFRPNMIKPELNGAGGAPIRTTEDLCRIDEAARCGNWPLLRCYSGTRDLLAWAEMSHQTLQNAWAAVPLFWYSCLDGRSDRTLEEAIRENQAVMAWHGQRGIPVEVNESHHWSLRRAPDVVAVAAAFLAAYNAKRAGVRHYIAQLMMNNPPGTSPIFDLAKLQAKIDLMLELIDDDFYVIREVRAGLDSLSPRQSLAKGQLAVSTQLGLALKPQIIHVVSYCEAHHAAGVDEIIESCGIVDGVLKNALLDQPDPFKDPRVIERRNELCREARLLLQEIAKGSTAEDPWADPATLMRAVKQGLLDAPQLAGNLAARGTIRTGMIDGACEAITQEGRRLTEVERLRCIGEGFLSAGEAPGA